MDPIWLKAILKSLVLPPTGPLLLSVLGLLIIVRRPRAGRVLAATGVVLLLALSMPAVAAILMRCIDQSPPLDLEVAKTAQAIVILGGGTRRDAAEYGGDTLGRLTLERVRYGARVARQSGLPVMVAGGSVSGGAPEAQLMRRALKDEFGVPVEWIEDRSRTTHQNALYSAKILKANQIRRIVLVAHGFDMPRATAEFGLQGIETVKAPTGISLHPWGGAPRDWLPTISGLQSSYYAVYEILALTVFWLSVPR